MISLLSVPSWSWASAPPRVVFPNCRAIQMAPFAYEWTAEVHSANASPMANEQMYQDTGSIYGYLKKMHNTAAVFQRLRDSKFV